MRMPIYLHLCSSIITNWRIRQNKASFSIYLTNMQLNVYSHIDQLPFFFVITFHVLLPFFTGVFFSFLSIFNSYLHIMVVETLTRHIYDKYIFQGCRLPLVVFMTGLGSRAVLFLWSNLSVYILTYDRIYQFYLSIIYFIFDSFYFGRFQSFSSMVVLKIVVILVCSWEEVSSGSFYSAILATFFLFVVVSTIGITF